MKAEWSNKDSLEMPTTTTSDYIKREDAIDAACANCIYDEFLDDRGKRITEGIAEIPSADVIEVGKQYPATEFNVEEELKDGRLYFAIVRNEGGNDEAD